jgi:hypothetical protein
MSKAIDNLTEAMKFAGANRPRVGGFHTWRKFREKLA